MGLTKCPDCGKDVSDRASKCPYCGSPLQVDNAEGSVTNTIGGGYKEKEERAWLFVFDSWILYNCCNYLCCG